ncbi:MAG: hypothetical protein IGS54_11440 [Elainella sp. C42_A2020_010]|nr:hypothetical protein [Elainella sp. C42_A2020_010]
MAINLSRWFKSAAKLLTLLCLSLVMLLSLAPTAVSAIPERSESPVAVPGITEPVAGQNIEELKAQRREWQSKASSIHEQNDKPQSLGEAVNEKLNLDELTEGYDPERENQKAYERDPLGSR